MKLNLDSLKKIIGDNQDVMVYGFRFCMWQDLCHALRAAGYHVHEYDLEEKPFKQIEYDIPSGFCSDNQDVKRACKTTLASLMLENYRRSCLGKPLIPLLFAVGLKGKEWWHHFELNYERIAKDASISPAELRRLYKLYAEMGEEMQAILEKTAKYIKLEEINPDEYRIELLTPFYKDPEWEKAWEAREAAKKEETKEEEVKTNSLKDKLHPWRVELKTELQAYNPTLFNAPNIKTNIESEDCSQANSPKSKTNQCTLI